MKKIFTLTICLLVLNLKSQIPWSYDQYFEPPNLNNLTIAIGTNTDNIWQIGVPQKTLFASASTTPHAIITLTLNTYPLSNVSSFSFAVAHQTTNPWPYALQWNQKIDMEAGQDGGIVEFSMNSGQTWQNAHNNTNVSQFYGFQPGNKDTINTNEYCFSGTDNLWRSIWLCIAPPTANSNDTICYRFIFKSDAAETNQEGWILDNFYAHHTVFHPVKEHSLKDNVTVYPNTTTGIVNIEAKNEKLNTKIDNIILTDINGKIIENYGTNYAKVVIDLSKHPSGTYFFTIRIGAKVESHKVIYVKE